MMPSPPEHPSGCHGLAAALLLLEGVKPTTGRPLLVGVGGPGGSGKSTFARKLAQVLGEAQVLPLDDYRKPRDQRGRGIFGSHPAGNRIELVKLHLEQARAGKSIERPVFCRERGAAHDSETLRPGRYLIVDGEISTHQGLREHFDVRILIDAGWALQWRARMGRDRRERSTSLLKALHLFWASNLLDYPRHAAGAAAEAHLVLRRSSCGRHLMPEVP